MIYDKLAQRGRDFLGVKYPIIAGAMTWISDFNLAKAVSENGAFAVLAAGNMPPELFEQEVDRCVAGLKKPFAVNLITIAPNYRAHYEILQSKNVPFVVFAGSFPRKADIQGMKAAGKRTMSFASEESIARQQIQFGVDALVLEGSEAGGHIGHVSLMILLQQVLFEFKEVPIFVGGGIATGRMMAHMLTMGAAGCQFGTRFVMTEECTAHDKFKEVFKRAKARYAISTPQYDSKLPVVAVRSIKNAGTDDFGKLQLQLLKRLEKGEITRETAQYEVENFWMGALRRAVVDGDVEGGSLMAGQSVGLMKDILPMRKVIENLVSEAEIELQNMKTMLCC
ncbi:nitronate monooxygenase family protein [Chitinispirillales bacterium ANBcel5]|uniref:NAD(P)H-dependent flavin oxidoreductase n=1 Tax=Cellulosispirillum alkaliphilum TaxID=3039283 RepID=UPI002A57C590|nr:nitronate monooxygenase family protein [Chitinispirillales bacterium ANBcel5]